MAKNSPDVTILAGGDCDERWVDWSQTCETSS